MDDISRRDFLKGTAAFGAIQYLGLPQSRPLVMVVLSGNETHNDPNFYIPSRDAIIELMDKYKNLGVVIGVQGKLTHIKDKKDLGRYIASIAATNLDAEREVEEAERVLREKPSIGQRGLRVVYIAEHPGYIRPHSPTLMVERHIISPMKPNYLGGIPDIYSTNVNPDWNENIDMWHTILPEAYREHILDAKKGHYDEEKIAQIKQEIKKTLESLLK